MIYENQPVLPYILVDNLFRFSIMMHILFINGLFFHHVILQLYFSKCSISKSHFISGSNLMALFKPTNYFMKNQLFTILSNFEILMIKNFIKK